MKFEVRKTSDGNSLTNEPYEVEFNTLEELIEWCQNTHEQVIINATLKELEIYNYYRE